MRVCKDCHKELPISEFAQVDNGAGYKATRRTCRECYNARERERYKTSDKYKYRGPQRYHGIEYSEYQEIFNKHHYTCCICGNRATCLDHSHTTGAIRGVLCSRCNLGLGHFNDSPELLEKAITYLSGCVA